MTRPWCPRSGTHGYTRRWTSPRPRCVARDHGGGRRCRLGPARRPYPPLASFSPQRQPPTIRKTLTSVDTPYETHVGYGALERPPWEMHKTTFRRRGPHLGSFYSEAEDGEQFYTQPSNLLNKGYSGAYGPGAAKEVPRRQGLADAAEREEDSEEEEDHPDYRNDPHVPARGYSDL